MIEKLKAELDRINQGCGIFLREGEEFEDEIFDNELHCGDVWKAETQLCPTCQERKQTLKKVSLMWADEMFLILNDIRFSSEGYESQIDVKLEELQEIKSLMAKESAPEEQKKE
jgi:hypothetical protein